MMTCGIPKSSRHGNLKPRAIPVTGCCPSGRCICGPNSDRLSSFSVFFKKDQRDGLACIVRRSAARTEGSHHHNHARWFTVSSTLFASWTLGSVARDGAALDLHKLSRRNFQLLCNHCNVCQDWTSVLRYHREEPPRMGAPLRLACQASLAFGWAAALAKSFFFLSRSVPPPLPPPPPPVLVGQWFNFGLGDTQAITSGNEGNGEACIWVNYTIGQVATRTLLRMCVIKGKRGLPSFSVRVGFFYSIYCDWRNS